MGHVFNAFDFAVILLALGASQALFGIKLPNFGRSLGVKISPKGVSLGMPKLNIGDMLRYGMMFGTGNFAGMNSMADWGKMGLGNFAKNTGLDTVLSGKAGFDDIMRLAMSFGGDGTGSLLGGAGAAGLDQSMQKKLLKEMADRAFANLEREKKYRPIRDRIRDKAVQDLDPSMNFTRAAQAAGVAQRDADRIGEQEVARLQASNASPAAIEGVRHSLAANAVTLGNQATKEAMNPERIAQQRAAQLQLLDDGQLDQQLSSLQAQYADLERQRQQYLMFQSQQPTLMTTLLPLLGEMLAKDPSILNGSRGSAPSATPGRSGRLMNFNTSLGFDPFQYGAGPSLTSTSQSYGAQPLRYDPFAFARRANPSLYGSY